MKVNANSDAAIVEDDLMDVRSRILTIRGVQVMLDRDLAELYQVSTKRLNEQVKRNINRFPDSYMFSLSKNEMSEVVANCDRFALMKHSVVPMNAFTEHGIIMLSAVLKSDVAVLASVRVVNAFVAMRKALASIAPLLSRIETVEQRQIFDQARNEDRFKLILDAMQDKTFPSQKVFYDGEIFDADAFATKHVLSAKKSIILIDNWVDIATLEMLAKKNPGVFVEIVSSPRGNRISSADLSAFNAQYGGLTVRTSMRFHDRFLIIDDKRLYLIGASLKDLGKKCFAFVRLDPSEISGLKARLI